MIIKPPKPGLGFGIRDLGFGIWFGFGLGVAINLFFWIYLLVMPKYWGTQIFSLGSFPEVGQKQKKEERKLEITMTTHCNATSGGARKAAWVKILKVRLRQGQV